MTLPKHFSSLAIRGFRGLKDIEFAKLGRINVIVGTNDVGKTSVLEALFLLAGFGGLPLPVLIQNLRGHAVTRFRDLRYLFCDLATDLQLSASTSQDDRSLTIAHTAGTVDQESQLPMQTGTPDDGGAEVTSYSSAPAFPEFLDFSATTEQRYSNSPTNYHGVLSVRNGKIKMDAHQGLDPSMEAIVARIMVPGRQPDAKIVSEVLVNKRQDVLIDCLRHINPRIARVTVSDSVVYVDIGLDTMIPLTMCGSGLVRAAEIVSACTLGQVDILLIDELGSGLHHSSIRPVLEAIISICDRQDIQVFFTTHSLEVLQCVQQVLDSDSFDRFRDDTKTYRLARDKDDRVRAYRYDYDKLEHFLSKGLEIR